MNERVEKKCQEYKELRLKIQQEYRKALSEKELLRKNEFTNQELLRELKVLLQTTESFIKTKINTIEYTEAFDLNTFWKDANENILCIDGESTPATLEKMFMEEEFSSIRDNTVNAYKNLNDILTKIKKESSILDAGAQGENNLYNRLKILGNKVRILRNISYAVDDFVVEHDMIIISKCGIFTVEIKNWKQNSILDERGYLSNKHGKKANIVEQTMRHVHNLEQTLYTITNTEYNVYPIIAWVNETSKLDNRFTNLTVCNYNNIEFEILNEDKYKDRYSADEVDKLYGLLKEIQIPAKKYPLEFDRNLLIDSVTDVVTGWLFLPDAYELDDELSSSFVKKALLVVGGVVASAVGGFCYYLSKDN